MNEPDWRIEPGVATDLAALVEIERLCSPHPWSPRLLETALSGAAGETVIVARRHATAPPLGFCVSRLAADEVEIHNVAVHPAHQRQGLGRRLLATALEAARDTAAVAHLEVRAGNSAAIALYERLGFQRTGRRKDYYASPAEDALLFSLSLPAPRG